MFITAVSWNVPKKLVKSKVWLKNEALTTPLLHHFLKEPWNDKKEIHKLTNLMESKKIKWYELDKHYLPKYKVVRFIIATFNERKIGGVRLWKRI